MQIADYLGQYANSLNAAAQPAANASGSSVQNLVSALTEQLQAGTIFEGSVNSIDGSKVLLGLGNGQTIAARLDGNVNLLLGQSVFFQVKSNDGNTIAIKPYAGGQLFNPTIQKALEAAGMEMTEETIDLVNRMMEEGMPIDKHALASMRQTLMQNPLIPMSTAITMSRLGIPVNNQMAAQFENYQNDRHEMLGQMDKVMDALPDVYAKHAGDMPKLLQLNQQILTILGEGMPKGDETAKVFTEAPQESQSAEEPLQAQGNLPKQENAQAQQADTVEKDTNAAKQPVQAQQTADTQEAQPRQAADLLSRHQMAELETQLKQVFPEAKGMKLNAELTAKELLDAIARQLNESQPLPDDRKEALSKLLSGREYHALVKDVMEQQWTVRPQELKTEHKIEELYQRLDRQMGQIEQLAKQAGMNTGQLSQAASQVRDNIEFMNQINQAYTYVQIPLKMANQNAHSDLYVYTNKRNLKNKEGELSAFLHLDLEHLGSTDVSIKMLDKKVNAKFYLEDDAAYDLIEAHMPQLEERLVKLGYHCSLSIENREEKVDFVEDFLQKSQPAKAANRGMVHRYSFDVRA